MGDGGAVGDDWATALRALLDAQPRVGSVEESVRLMEGLAWPASGNSPAGTISVAAIRRTLANQRARMRATLQGLGCPEFGEERALAIHLYTKEQDFRLYAVVNGAMRRANRGDGPGGTSDSLRRCLPYIKFLCEALEMAPAQLRFDGRCHRGVKFAYSSAGTAASADDHNPGLYFRVGSEFPWFEFKSASRNHATMYAAVFCGASGPRTIFTIDGVHGVLIQAFSEQASEEEVLFPPLRRFQVTHVQKKLLPLHLSAHAAPGGFPDEVHLVAPRTAAIPAELKLRSGLEVIDFESEPLGAGSFADVWRGTYTFEAGGVASEVAFKVFRGSQALGAAMQDQIVQEARLGMRLQHPNLIELYGILHIPRHGLSLVTELADGGSLRSVLDDAERYPAIGWAVRLRLLGDICEGLHRLHSLRPRPLIHRDLKASNVLLSSPDINTAIAKVGDFGVASFAETAASRASGGAGGGSATGTLAWKAPETFRGRYSAASDTFGLAVTAYEMISRGYPYHGMAQPEVMRLASAQFEVQAAVLRFGISEEQQRQGWNDDNPLSRRRPDLTVVEDGCPPVLTELVQRCWADEAADRPSVRPAAQA